MFPAKISLGAVDVMVTFLGDGLRADAVKLAGELRAREAARGNLSRRQPEARKTAQVRRGPQRAGAWRFSARTNRRAAKSRCATCRPASRKACRASRRRRRSPRRVRLAGAVSDDRHRRNVTNLSNSHLRRSPSRARRSDRAPLRLGESQTRSRAAAVHRSPRSLRHHAVRVHARNRRPSGPPRRLKLESVIAVSGRVIARTEENINPTLPTGLVEVVVDSIEVLSAAEPLPFQVAGVQEIPEEQRLRYRFLDLRREKLHANIVLRSKVIASIRRRMQEQGFLEFQTPILTSSSPEGARDYLVPSRIHPGKFYALPQAPQQFKQLLMVAGFDRYFQIAPCFRDEDARADRSPGEFYQLDVEMSFVTQDDVFAAIEPVLAGVFREFSDWTVSDIAVPAHRLRRCDDDVRDGQAGPAQSDQGDRRDRDVPRIGVRGVRASGRSRARSSARFAPPAPPNDRAASSTRPSGWPRRWASAGWRTSSPPRRRRVRSRSICPTSGASRSFAAAGVERGDAVFFASGTPKGADARRGRPAESPGARARSPRSQRLSLLLGHRFSVLRARSRRPIRSRSATTRSRCRRAASRRSTRAIR